MFRRFLSGAGCESYSRALNGIIATLDNYTAMLRNKFHLRFKSETLSDWMVDYLKENTI